MLQNAGWEGRRTALRLEALISFGLAETFSVTARRANGLKLVVALVADASLSDSAVPGDSLSLPRDFTFISCRARWGANAPPYSELACDLC